MFTKKVKIKWQRDSYLNTGPADREGPQATALAEFDAKTAEMVAEGKMSADAIVEGSNLTIFSIRRVTDQAAAEEWVAFNDTFAAKYGFIKLGAEIKPN
jgi:hypothetical protein